MKIGVIDSGLGGELISNYLNKNYNYEVIKILDKEMFPYGNKSKVLLRKRLKELVNKLEDNHKLDKIVIACNTLSSLFFYDSYFKYKHKLYDVINPVIRYLEDKKYENILLLATTNTINSNVYQTFCNGDITTLDATKLIFNIEFGYDVTNDIYNIINNYYNYDAIILGCTHLIYIKEELRDLFKGDIISQDELINI